MPSHCVYIRGAFQYPKISLPKMSFGLVQSGWGESECFNKNLAPGSSEVFKDIFRAYRNAPLVAGADLIYRNENVHESEKMAHHMMVCYLNVDLNE